MQKCYEIIKCALKMITRKHCPITFLIYYKVRYLFKSYISTICIQWYLWLGEIELDKHL